MAEEPHHAPVPAPVHPARRDRRRASQSDPFGAPQELPAVNSDLHDMSPHISRDGCELFFIRGTEQDPYDWDIYRSEIQ